MTNSSDNRIDRIEALLEVFITASNERMIRLEQSMAVNNEQAYVADERLNQMSEKTDARFNQLVTEADANREITFMMLEQMTTLQEEINQMSEKTDARFNQLVTEADANREIAFMMLEQMTTLQEESKRLLDYLFGQQRNGKGDSASP